MTRAAPPQLSPWGETPSSTSGGWEEGSWMSHLLLLPFDQTQPTLAPSQPSHSWKPAACSHPATCPQRQRSGGWTIGKARGEVVLGRAEVGCLSTSGLSLPRAKELGATLQPSPICQASRDPFHPSSLAAGREGERSSREEWSPEQGKGRNPTQVTIAPRRRLAPTQVHYLTAVYKHTQVCTPGTHSSQGCTEPLPSRGAPTQTEDSGKVSRPPGL